jgi:hypothetical protein
MKIVPLYLAVMMLTAWSSAQSANQSSPPVVKSQSYKLVAFELPRDLTKFNQYITPHIDAVLIYADWSQMEPQQGQFDFSGIDSQISYWKAKGKQVVLILVMNSDVGMNAALPSWVKAQVPIIESCRNGGFGYQNFPLITDQRFVDFSRAFYRAALSHFSDANNIAYIRTGTVGGENTIPCLGAWPGGWKEPAFLAYLKSFGAFIQSLHPAVQFAQNATWQNGGTAAADTMYEYWDEYGIGAGMQALGAAGDVYPCTANWCKNFPLYPKQFHYLQSATRQPVGALASYVPFALSHGVNALELRVTDLSIAYNPNDPNYQTWGERYRDALGK